ncbi:hypothetical protein NP493_469g00002 [Ridgeia piscesae]|uniref:Saposin A-type domain-containing protein n=1 Tax=Ridgeia piscesae TaxID=27915 RepID=A0AAD9NR99_RIDPI|nr:hypothetical protein NP493_469g00002 [Ridgeia piscesae]
MYSRSVVVVCAVAVFATCASSAGCRFPPSVWCSSEDIAKECEVTEACRKNVWLSATREGAAVPLALYYETLCPDCKNFVQTQLWPAYQKVGSIMNVTLVPYGNAWEKQSGSRWEFHCQHGAPECQGNVIQTCAIEILQNFKVYFPFIHCMESSEDAPSKSAVQASCAKKFGINYKDIDACAQGTRGNRLEHQMALKTKRLNPPHTYVPWVTLHGVHTDKIQKSAEADLIQLICDTYQGKPPSGCIERLLTHHKCPRFDL